MPVCGLVVLSEMAHSIKYTYKLIRIAHASVNTISTEDIDLHVR